MDVDMDMDASPSNMNPKDLTIREQYRRYGYTSHYHISIPSFFFVLKIFLGFERVLQMLLGYMKFCIIYILQSRIGERESF